MARKTRYNNYNSRIRAGLMGPYARASLSGVMIGAIMFSVMTLTGVLTPAEEKYHHINAGELGVQDQTEVVVEKLSDDGVLGFVGDDASETAEISASSSRESMGVVEAEGSSSIQESTLDAAADEASGSRLPLSESLPGQPFRIVVLTMNRPWALTRLLESVDSAYYENEQIDMDIFIDMQKNKTFSEETVDVAEKFNWKRGNKRVVRRERNMGLILSWLTCWNATTVHDRAIILEDDLEVSPLYYRFLRESAEKYKDVADMAAYSLQRATLIPMDDGNRHIQHGTHPAYLYRLVGTWGFAPRASYWTEFQEWFFPLWDGKEFKPYVDGLKINHWYNGREWSNWFLRFCDDKKYFNLYGNMPDKKTLSANWREPGEHYGKGPAKGREFEIFEAEKDYEFNLPEPENLVRVDWNGRLHLDFHSELYRDNMEQIDQLVEYAKDGEFLALALYNSYFMVWVRNFLCNVELLGVKPERLAFVTNDKKAHDTLSKYGVYSIYLKFEGGESARGNTFSTPGYITLMLNRARLVYELLSKGVTTLLFDPDQTWLEDPIPYVKQLTDKGGVDLVGTITTQKELAGNFLYFVPSELTLKMYAGVVDRFEQVFNQKKIGEDSAGSAKISSANDQTLITEFALRQGQCVLELLDAEKFCDGRWYKGAYSNDTVSIRPVIVNNNFVEGNEEKLHRAEGFGHLFYNSKTDSCETPPTLRAYLKGKSIYYSWQQVLEKKKGDELLQ